MPKKYLIILFIPFLGGCFDTQLKFEDQFEPVVEAYIYVDKAVDKIKLSSMVSFGSDSTGGEMITDALISLEKDFSVWFLDHNDSVPGSYYLQDGPKFSPGETIKLKVELDDAVLTATTLVPGSPPAVKKSAASMYIPKVDDPREFRDMEMPDPVELSWENPEANYYFLHIQNIETNPMAIRPEVPDGIPAGRGPGEFAFEILTQPTNSNFHIIEPLTLQYYGTYRIVMTSVNEEYVNLYSSLMQDSRELNEPYSNINNGLGIFTAFNSDTLYLEVIPVYQGPGSLTY